MCSISSVSITLSTVCKVERYLSPCHLIFSDGLLTLEEQAAQDYFDINRGENTTRGRKVSALVNDARICNLTRLLDRNQITMSNFLRNASRTLENPYRRHCPRPPPQV